MKLSLISALTLLLSGNTFAYIAPEEGPAPIATSYHKRCQSASRCFYSNVPTLIQSSDKLTQFIGSMIRDDSYEANGLCVPTAGAMAIYGVLSERNSRTNLNNYFLNGFQARNWWENVYAIGSRSKTDFADGGTVTAALNKTYNFYFKDVKPYIGFKHTADGIFLGRTDITNTQLITNIRNHKYMYTMAVSRHERNEQSSIVWYKRVKGHAMLIKGFDSDRLHIQDPWGYEYFARAERQSFKTTLIGLGSTHTVFRPVTSTGWMGTYASNKLVLNELIGLSLD